MKKSRVCRKYEWIIKSTTKLLQVVNLMLVVVVIVLVIIILELL